MKRSTLVGLSVCALVLGACASIESIEPRQALPLETQQASPFPEPPPWNSLEMMWMDTEIV
jgi:hypothetical protein